MHRRSLLTWLVVIAWLGGVGSAQAGNPFGWLGFGHHAQTPPAPRVIEVIPPAEAPDPQLTGTCFSPGSPAAPAYPWGYFGARPGMGFVWHSGYYGDVSHWCQ